MDTSSIDPNEQKTKRNKTVEVNELLEAVKKMGMFPRDRNIVDMGPVPPEERDNPQVRARSASSPG